MIDSNEKKTTGKALSLNELKNVVSEIQPSSLEFDLEDNLEAIPKSQLTFEQCWKEPIEKMRKEYDPLLTEDYEDGHSVSNQKKVFLRKNYKLEEFSSTILIPDQYMDFFKKKIYEHKGVRAYIAYLLYKYRLHIANGIVPSYSSVTTKYQKKGQDLHKISFRPRVSDWAELKLYRVSFGMSISSFLMFLLIADYMDFAKVVSYFLVAVGIHTTPDLDLIAKVYLFRKKSYHSTVFQYREDKTG